MIGTKPELILHPPHLLDSDGSLMPAAFIPICAYQGQLLGKTSPEFNFTACDLFEPTLVKDQLCYSLNSTKMKNWKTKPNSENGLALVIDPEASLTGSGGFGSFTIHTLSGFHADQPGTYKLTSLKWMTGTSKFMGLDDQTKECQVEASEKCKQSQFFTKVRAECGCIPWAMRTFVKVKVRTHLSYSYASYMKNIFSLSSSKYCA